MTNDGKVHANGLHPDQHALVFVRTGQGKQVFFSASDGGIWRQEGPYVDRSSDCGARGLIGPERVDCQQYLSAIPSQNQSLNKGLQTLQFQSASVTPGDAGIIQGGTQDNGTWESDDPDGFAETVGGDGGQSGFNVRQPADPLPLLLRPAARRELRQRQPDRAGTGSPTRCSTRARRRRSTRRSPPTRRSRARCSTVCSTSGGPRTTAATRAYLDQHCNEISGDFDGALRRLGSRWAATVAGDLSGGDAGQLRGRRSSGRPATAGTPVGRHPAGPASTSRPTPTRPTRPR